MTNPGRFGSNQVRKAKTQAMARNASDENGCAKKRKGTETRPIQNLADDYANDACKIKTPPN